MKTGRLPAKLVRGRYELDIAAVDALVASDTLPMPAPWRRTVTGEPMRTWLVPSDALEGLRSSSRASR
jgi:hypothetical protein